MSKYSTYVTDRQPSTRHAAEYDEHPVRGDVQDTLRPTTADSELTAGYLSARDQGTKLNCNKINDTCLECVTEYQRVTE